MELNTDTLDPGIRRVVGLLRASGFDTTDSGDGASKPAEERALDVPHVFIRTTAEAMLREAKRLSELLCDAMGVHDLSPGVIQASFDPADGFAVLAVMGLDDARLLQGRPQIDELIERSSFGEAVRAADDDCSGEHDALPPRVIAPPPALTREAGASRFTGSDLQPVSLHEGDVLAQFPQPRGWSHGAPSSWCVASEPGTAGAAETGAFCLESGLCSLCGSVLHCPSSTALASSEQGLSPSSADCTVVESADESDHRAGRPTGLAQRRAATHPAPMPDPDDPEWLGRNRDYGLRLEVVDGVGVWELAPSYEHQDAIDSIRATIRASAQNACTCVHKSDVNVRFGGGQKRPDIALWCGVPERRGGCVDTIPEAVVEVISPGYEEKDLALLPPFYLRHGVKDVVVFDYATGLVRHFTAQGVVATQSPTRITLRCGCEFVA